MQNSMEASLVPIRLSEAQTPHTSHPHKKLTVAILELKSCKHPSPVKDKQNVIAKQWKLLS